MLMLVEELRMDFRALLSRREDWWYDRTAPFLGRLSHSAPVVYIF